MAGSGSATSGRSGTRGRSAAKRVPGDGGSRARAGKHPPTTTLPALLEQGSDAKFRRLLYDFLTLSQRMRAMREHLGHRAGLTAPQYTFLMAVMELADANRGNGGGKGVAMRELADYLQVTPAFVTHESNILLRMRLITKEANPHDRRSTLLFLSKEGARLVDALLPEVRAINDLFFSQLDPTAFKRAQALLAGLLEGSERALAHVVAGRAVAAMRRRGPAPRSPRAPGA